MRNNFYPGLIPAGFIQHIQNPIFKTSTIPNPHPIPPQKSTLYRRSPCFYLNGRFISFSLWPFPDICINNAFYTANAYS